MSEENDTRPMHSPYASDVCPVYFQGNGPLYIPRTFLNQSPELASGAVPDRFTLASDDIHVENIAFDAGHAIIHYLVTNTYQCLKPTEIFPEKNDATELATAIRVYSTTETISLSRLRNLAREEIVRLGDKLELPTLIKVMEDSIPSFQNLPGIAAYVESRILSFAENSSRIAANKALENIGVPDTLNNVLLRSIVLMKASEQSLVAEPIIQHVTADRGTITLRPVLDAIILAETQAEAKTVEDNLREAQKVAVACEVAEIRDLRLRKATRGKLTSTQRKRLNSLVRNAAERAEVKAASEAIEAEAVIAEKNTGSTWSGYTFGIATASSQNETKKYGTGESPSDKDVMNSNSKKVQGFEHVHYTKPSYESEYDTDQISDMVYPMTPSFSQASSF